MTATLLGVEVDLGEGELKAGGDGLVGLVRQLQAEEADAGE